MEAVKKVPEPQIALSASATDGKPRVQISDNGRGIPADLLDNIFIPFFTTRKSGSGVGLTLSKQIMLLHGGNILRSEEHTSELQSLMRISYAVFCLKKQHQHTQP